MRETDSISRLEYQLANLARTLEAINRRRKYPLERAHYLLLLHLRKGALSVGELAAKLALDNSTVTRQLNAMEKRSLIIKRPNPADGRSALIERTQEGCQLAEAMHDQRTQRIERMLENWTQEDIETCSKLTARLTDALNRSMDEPD